MAYFQYFPFYARIITGNHVKKALKSKTQRYRSGHFRPLNRPRTPRSTPLINSKRYSRSLSDITSLLTFDTSLMILDSDQILKVSNCNDFNSGSEASHSIQVDLR